MRKQIARTFLRLTGWEAEGGRPPDRKFVLVAAPHTSNWDLFYLLSLAAIYDVSISFLMKHTMFRGPLGPLFQAAGGIPVRRDRRANLVKQLATLFRERDELVLVIPAEGTRGARAHWKSGFYHVAREAGVPIYLGYLDYRRRRGGFGIAIRPSGDVRADMDRVRAFYADKTGKHPEGFTSPRLAEEDEAPAQ